MSELRVVLQVGTTFAGDFLVEGALGMGGMGAVHRVRQISTEKARALKVMRPELLSDMDLRRRFIQEARVGSRIESDHVVEVHAAGIDESSRLPYLVMELLDGCDLGAHMAARGPLPISEVREILQQVYHAISAAHAVGIVHRDIKPENIFLGRSRRSGVALNVKLLDFGIAKIVAEATAVTATTAALGSPLWMAPEQTGRGPITPGADTWALGLLAFYMLTGRFFWREAALEKMSFAALVRELLVDTIPSATARAAELGRGFLVPAGFDSWFARSVIRDVTARFSEGTAQWAALWPVLAAEPPAVNYSAPPSEGVSQMASTVSALPAAPDMSETEPAIVPVSDDGPVRIVAARAARLPGPLAALGAKLTAAETLFARRCALVEIAGAIVRYAAAVALARLASDPSWRPSLILAATIGCAARWSEGAWCTFARALNADLEQRDAPLAHSLAFLTEARANDVARLEEQLVSDTGTTSDFARQVLALLDEGAELLGPELRAMRAMGAPSAAEHVYRIDGDRLLSMGPWLPRVDERICLPDAPHAAGEPWRAYDVERGEHRHAQALDAALRALLGESTQLPPPLNHAPALIGRDAALEAVRRAAREASAGAVRVVVLAGPLGIGRTRLLRIVRDEAAALGFVEAVETSCSRERRSALRALSGIFANRSALARVDEAIRCASSEIRTGSAETFEAVVESVEEELLDASLATPVMLLVDELQWADEATLLLLSLLTERASMHSRGRLLIVGSVRAEPNPSERLARLLGQIEQEVGPAASRIELATLTDDEARLVVRSVAPVSTDVEEHVVRGAGGVPSFLVQPLLTWNEKGALVWKDGAWSASSPALWSQAPPGLSDLVRARLASYFGARSPALHAAETVLAIVAVAGRLPADRLVRTLERLDIAAPLADGAIQALVEASLLSVAGGRSEYTYRQPILRRAAVEVMEGRPWFGRTYRAFLDSVAREANVGAEAGLLANGYESLGLYDEARTWLPRAAKVALETGLVDDAVTFAERLCAIAPNAAGRAVAGIVASEALLRAGRGADAARRHAEIEWLGVDDERLLVRGRTLGVSILAATGARADDTGGALLVDADALGDASASIEARVAVAAAQRGRPGLLLLEAAEQRLAGVPQTEADLRYRVRSLRLELLYEVRAAPEEWRAIAALARAAAREAGSVWAELDVEADLAVLEAEAGRPDVAVEILTGVAQRAREARLGTVMRNALNNIAACQRLAGRHAAAAEAATIAERAARDAGSWRHLAAALSIRAAALVELGALEEALVALDESVELQLEAGSARVSTALMRRAEVRRRLGNGSGARADVNEVLMRAEREGAAADVARAQVWLAIEDVRDGADGADGRLAALLDRTGTLLEKSPDGRALAAAGRQLVSASSS